MSTKLTTIETAQQLPELAALGESKMQSVLEVFKPLSEQLEALRTPEEERIENEKRIAVAALHNERREKALPFHDFWSQFERDLNFGEVSQADFDAFMVRIEAAKQAELSKGDAAKFADFVADLEALKTKYSFKSAANQKKYADAGVLLSKIIDHVSK